MNATNGLVTKNPDLAVYDSNTTVQLRAIPATGYHFTNWSGDLSSLANSVTVIMNANKIITANFAINTYTLTVTTENGTVTKNPNLTAYDSNTTVKLRAIPATGYHFTNWSGDLSDSTNPVNVTMNANRNVIAKFAINTYTLTVNATNGTVTKNPNRATYDSNSVVMLKVIPTTGYFFIGWSGDLSGSTNPVYLKMDANKNVTANFIFHWGDINLDDEINVIDLIIAADYVTGKRIPEGINIFLADVNKWESDSLNPTGDGKINILDLIGLENIFLNNAYPNGHLLAKVTVVAAYGGLSKATSNVDARLTFNISKTGIVIRLKNTVAFKGMQVDFQNISTKPGDVTSSFGLGFAKLDGNVLRTLVYDRTGAVLAPGEHLMIIIPVKIDSPSTVIAQNLLVADSNNQKLSNVELETTVEAPPLLPTDFALGQNYPNPFNPSTSINVAISQTSQVRITIYNMLGQEVRTLFDGQMEGGVKTINWNGKDQIGRTVASGTYLYRMRAGNFVATKKMVLLK